MFDQESYSVSIHVRKRRLRGDSNAKFGQTTEVNHELLKITDGPSGVGNYALIVDYNNFSMQLLPPTIQY